MISRHQLRLGIGLIVGFSCFSLIVICIQNRTAFLLTWRKNLLRTNEPIKITRHTTANGTDVCNKLPDDIVLFNPTSITERHLCCNTCAIVSSAGILKGRSAGKEIERTNCIFRLNNAPTVGYEVDVGSRTTYRIMAHSAVNGVKALLQTHKTEANTTIFIEHGPRHEQIQNQLRDLKGQYPEAQSYFFTQERFNGMFDIFDNETGHKYQMSKTYLSCGWVAMLIAREICSEIHLYGFVDEDHCNKVRKKILPSVPYHYYQKDGGSNQCSVYEAFERSVEGHRYFAEKMMFKRWAEESGNIEFHHPEWK